MYRPFIFLLWLVLISGTVYWIAQHANLIVSTEQSEQSALRPPIVVHTFYPYQYAVQMIIPVMDLQQTQYWSPKPGGGGWELALIIFNYIIMLIGWLTVLAVIPGVSRYYRSR